MTPYQSTPEQVACVREIAARPSKWRPWLPSDPTAALVCCVGAGKFARRQKVQHEALLAVNGRDLRDVTGTLFPLDWQNKFIENAASW